MTDIHSTAMVNKNAELGDNIKIGPYAIIEGGVKIDDGTQISSHVLVADGAEIGKNCKIYQGAVLGTEPQDLKFGDEKTFLVVGDNTTIREYATLNRATTYSYYTRVGNNCFLMAYSHIAHDCEIGNNVIIANSVNMAGHVIIEDSVGVGGLTAIHQFVHIGSHCFVGGGLRVSKDVPPYILAMGEPLSYGGLNTIGLKRKGFKDNVLSQLKNAYKIIYRENLTLNDAIQKIEDTFEKIPEIENLLKFLHGSERGILR